jgi:hypothetical protein
VWSRVPIRHEYASESSSRKVEFMFLTDEEGDTSPPFSCSTAKIYGI